ncbi:hypothetical protein KAW80_02845 [Candidatus Babeliales bacterium]|nr:hypothetical protein [Candidatus Babeliales bacterium]
MKKLLSITLICTLLLPYLQPNSVLSEQEKRRFLISPESRYEKLLTNFFDNSKKAALRDNDLEALKKEGFYILDLMETENCFLLTHKELPGIVIGYGEKHLEKIHNEEDSLEKLIYHIPGSGSSFCQDNYLVIYKIPNDPEGVLWNYKAALTITGIAVFGLALLAVDQRRTLIERSNRGEPVQPIQVTIQNLDALAALLAHNANGNGVMVEDEPGEPGAPDGDDDGVEVEVAGG